MGNLSMEALSQLLELIKQSGLSVMILLAIGLFAYKKGWPWWIANQEKRDNARETKDNKYLDTLNSMNDTHAKAIIAAGQSNAAAVDRNTAALKEIGETVRDIARPAVH